MITLCLWLLHDLDYFIFMITTCLWLPHDYDYYMIMITTWLWLLHAYVYFMFMVTFCLLGQFVLEYYMLRVTIAKGPSLPQSSGSWIYIYLYSQCISLLMLWIGFPPGLMFIGYHFIRGLGLCCLTPLSTIFQLYRGGFN